MKYDDLSDDVRIVRAGYKLGDVEESLEPGKENIWYALASISNVGGYLSTFSDKKSARYKEIKKDANAFLKKIKTEYPRELAEACEADRDLMKKFGRLLK